MAAIGIIGRDGRMGQAIAAAIEGGAHTLVGGVDKGEDVAGLADRSDVLIDFSAPGALHTNLHAAVGAGVPILIGTTGLEAQHHTAIDNAARAVPVLQTGNTSLGVTLLAHLVREAAQRLGPDWDIEILEMHHRRKVDAPSGTAILLGEAAAEGRGIAFADNTERGRDGQTGARAQGAIGFASPDNRMQLINEEQNTPIAILDLVENGLESLLKFAAVLRAGDHRAEVHRDQRFVFERFRDVAAVDAPGQSLGDGGLADARLADEHRVVLGAARQDLHDPFGLPGPADHRIQPLLAGGLREVAAELVQDEGPRSGVTAAATRGRTGLLLGARGTLARPCIAGEQLDDLLADPGEVGAQLHQDLGCDALALPDEAQEDVLRAYVVVAQLQRLAQRELQDLLGPWGERNVPAGGTGTVADELLDLAACGLQRDAEGLQALGGHALTLVDQPEQDVLRADVVVVEQPRLFLGEYHDPPGPVGEPLEQRAAS